MKLGKLKFSEWRRFAGCWEIYADELQANYINYTFAITVYHNKKEDSRFNLPSEDYYDPLTLSNWIVCFYNVSDSRIDVSKDIQNVHNSLYGGRVSATEKDIKKHVSIFIQRLNKIKIFI